MDRTKGIGGSDAPVICGVSPWKTATELYYEKAGLVTPEDISDRDAVYWGTQLEDLVAKEYAKRTGHKVRRVNRTLVHKDHPFINAHIDRDVVKTNRILECKTTNAWSYGGNDWGEEGTDEVPSYYLLQCMHYLAVTGAEVCDLAVLVGGQRFAIYVIERDEHLIDTMITVEVEFWNRVQSGNPPEMDFHHRSAGDLVKKLHPDVEGETNLDDLAQVLHDREQEVAASIKTLDAERKALKAQLLDLIGSAERAYLPGGGGFVRSVVPAKDVSFTRAERVDCRFRKSLKQQQAA